MRRQTSIITVTVVHGLTPAQASRQTGGTRQQRLAEIRVGQAGREACREGALRTAASEELPERAAPQRHRQLAERDLGLVRGRVVAPHGLDTHVRHRQRQGG